MLLQPLHQLVINCRCIYYKMALELMRKLKRLFGSKESAPSAPMESPSTFYARELGKALGEQSFGIHDFKITEDSPLQCSASVTLLEGNTIQVTLKKSGYSVSVFWFLMYSLIPYYTNQIDNSERETGTTQQIHESIESLLASASPLFEQKGQEELIKALERLG